MKAVIIEEFGAPVQLREVEPQPVSPCEVRIEVGASGICHSDYSIASGQYPAMTIPLVLGHEGAGRVIEVGSAVRRVAPGDRVICTFVPACGICWQCLSGRSHLCETNGKVEKPKLMYDGRLIAALSGLGTMAPLMTVHETNVVKVETDLPDEQLALIGCGITTGVGSALWTARVEPGASVAIFGCGGVGLAVLQGARIAGAAELIAVDPFASKREMALAMGATHAIDPTAEDPVARIREITRGRGAEYTFEVISTPATMRQTYDAACNGGTATMVGSLSPSLELALPANGIHLTGKRLLGSAYGSAQVQRDMPRLVALAEAGRLDVGSMVSRRISLGEVNEAFDAMKRGEVVRSVITSF
ncbi:Zn-dependent alcohol dehydrogenase [Novosphingobium bradum]|uniref:Zn-dependent alcohol dehydrogenase n=1 Tax=Novosphingobium bradum TaxID=1737444 RepID=A0ABV7IU69_9SPHN